MQRQANCKKELFYNLKQKDNTAGLKKKYHPSRLLIKKSPQRLRQATRMPMSNHLAIRNFTNKWTNDKSNYSQP